MDYKTKIKNIDASCILNKLPPDCQVFAASKIISNDANSSKDFIFITKNDAAMDVMQKQLKFFLPEKNNLEILTFPAWDCQPFDRVSPKGSISSARIKCLHQLANRGENQNFIIITSINAISQKIINQSQIKDLGLFLEVGSSSSIPQIANFLINKGFERRACANNIGEFAIRGGILDIVMQQAFDIIGYRIDFFGDEVESIKIFDPITQISEEKVKQIEILPASEVILSKRSVENFRQQYRQNFGAALDDQLYLAISENRSAIGMEHYLPLFYQEKLSSLFSYLKKPIAFFDDEFSKLAGERHDLVQEYYQARLDEKNLKNNDLIYNALEPSSLYFSPDELAEILSKNSQIKFNQFDEVSSENKRILDLEIKPTPDFALAGRANKKDPINLMQDYYAANNSNNKVKIALACMSQSFKDRIAKILLDYQIPSVEINNFADIEKLKPGILGLFLMPINFGFHSSDLMLIGEQALFGEKIVRKKSSRQMSKRLLEESMSINIGELVVHRDHGIGKFDGIHLIESGGIKSDFLKIIYGGNDTLFIPIDDINLISRYGADNPLIQLDRLGVAAWKNRRDKIKKKIKLAAEELLKIAAARKLKKAKILIPDQHLYEEFKNNFKFVETEDQISAITEIEEDLQKGTPMDRLICGDVGFGKTEVAMRAAAIAVFSNVKELEATPSPLGGEGWGEGSTKENLTPLAKKLRKNQTDSEAKLWSILRNRQIANTKFRRQHQIKNYITDFVSIEEKLIIELDGGQHNFATNLIKDEARDKELRKDGFDILRISNNEIFNNFDGVCQTIHAILSGQIDREEFFRKRYLAKSDILPSLANPNNQPLTNSNNQPLTLTLSPAGRGNNTASNQTTFTSQNQELDSAPSPLGGEGWGEGQNQVAIITPTTLLCRQHFQNFSERFSKTNVEIVQLSRLVSTSKAKENKEKIASGKAQIVIGTHALLQKNLKFKNLSLVIVDEEQHFGVAQKERLKELKNEVHLLTLSATPIPRTLQMSLTGVKDLSLIATPPIDRLAVRNFVMPYDSTITREAIMREFNRGGKIFFVVPRIRDIERMEPKLKELVPELKITHAHGQMTPTQLDDIMNDFVDGKIDMLLSTTIIESGIDISSANTMIIYKCEMFGLSQLYQLRGRVGRSNLRAYCYFMMDNGKKISGDAKKKLEVMQNIDSLGASFTVASHDMDIRGSGNLLGDEQSGHIKETGVELYQQMLLETIEKIKNKDFVKNNDEEIITDFSTQVKLGISLLIPENYIEDLPLRMNFYKKIANITSDEIEENLINEMTDRFGKIPGEIYNLIEIAKIKMRCHKLNISKIEAKNNGIQIAFKDNNFDKGEELLKLVFSSNNQIKLGANHSLIFICDVKSDEVKISSAQKAISQLENI